MCVRVVCVCVQVSHPFDFHTSIYLTLMSRGNAVLY